MSIVTDKAFYKSDFERNAHDAYYTEHWVTRALVKYLPAYVRDGHVWEPAAGRGDITRVLQEAGIAVSSSDLYPQAPCIKTQDFFTAETTQRVDAIITNPPFGKLEGSKKPLSELFTRKALTQADFVAMLLRSEFNHGGKYRDLFTAQNYFAFEIVLTSRPRWDDWWNGKPPKAAPRHNFSWFVWDKLWQGPSTQYWEGRKENENANVPNT